MYHLFLRNEENVCVAAQELHCVWGSWKKSSLSGPGSVDCTYHAMLCLTVKKSNTELIF